MATEATDHQQRHGFGSGLWATWEIIADQTTEEIADDETFDVDTIFTSGTFEIAAGGGNPDDSIFQGEVELAQMKMTRLDGTWSPEFWQASGIPRH